MTRRIPFSFVALFGILVAAQDPAPAPAPAAAPAVAPAPAPAATPAVAPAPAPAPAVAPAPDKAVDLVRIAGEKRAAGPERVEYAYTFACRAGGASPSLRVTFGQGSEFNASAGVTMPVDDQDQAAATMTLRVAMLDKAAGTFTVSVEMGPGGPTTLSRQFTLQAGQDLAAVADLRDPPATSPARHPVVFGSVAGSMLTAYVMPGRSAVRPTPSSPTLTPAEAATQAADAFRTWAAAVKRGDVDQVATIVPAAEWAGLSPEQKTQRLKEYQDSFRTVLGDDYAPEQFKVEFAGGTTFGRLRIRYGDKALPDLTARYIGGKWLLTEP